MKRLFDEHTVRRTVSLDGAWKFRTDPEVIGERDGWNRALPDGVTVTVPSVWNNEIGLLNYTGAAWYEKKFYAEEGTLRFVFEGVITAADVWLDGEHIGSHYGGFTMFDCIVASVGRGEHTLTVRADNRFDAHSIPQKKVDWYNYGGIARSVTVEYLHGITVLSCDLHYTLSEDFRTADVHAVLRLYNAGDGACTDRVYITLDETDLYSESVTLSGRETAVLTTPTVPISGIQLWSQDDPRLYTLTASVGILNGDDLIDRVGFRKIEVRNSEVLLNGKRVELCGVNRHEEHPDWGFAFPPKLMKRDLDIIEDLGCNTVRGSHYPNSKIFLDMLDERGILFWSEIPIWGCGFSEEALGDPVILERGLEMHREMVAQYYNHPSIVIWGMHNEILSETQNAYEMTKCFAAFLREHGGNRLLTHASHRPKNDICFEFDDIICLNVYYGWYSGDAHKWDNLMEEFRTCRASLGLETVPVVISEFGAGALYGYHNAFDSVRWSEEYQADLIGYCLDLFHKDPMVAGFYVWQFANIRTSPVMDLNRARTFNNKGILDEYRNPKSAYFAIRRRYHEFLEKGDLS